MELKLDRNKTYGLALEGGGAKGAYQIGAWKALREAGIRFSAVSGTSVGALNGAMIVMDDLEKAENVWNNIHFSQVMDVDDEEMRRLMNRDIPLSELKSTLRSVADIVRNRGFDVTPLRKWVAEVVDADKVCHSDTDFFIVTYSLTDHQELELKASDLDKDELCDMLLASAYLPAFRLEKLGGKYYADGGVQDVVPIHALVENGCKDIIALRIFGFGIEKRIGNYFHCAYLVYAAVVNYPAAHIESLAFGIVARVEGIGLGYHLGRGQLGSVANVLARGGRVFTKIAVRKGKHPVQIHIAIQAHEGV